MFILLSWLGGLLVFGLGVLMVAKSEFLTRKFTLGLIYSFLGIFVLGIVTFAGAPVDLPSGLPKTSIRGGEYKVVFVYETRGSVGVGIEKEERDNEHKLYLYQFPKTAFEGSVDHNAKKLVVIESGRFKKLSFVE